MGSFKSIFIIISLFLAIGASGCAQATIDPEAGKGAPVPRWLTFQVRRVSILADKGDGIDGQAEFQIFVVATDGETSAKLAYPAEGVVPVSVDESIELGKFALSVDTHAIGDELTIYMVAVDSDEQTAAGQLATDVVLDLLTGAVLAGVTGGSSLALDLFAGQATGLLAEWIRQSDVIGQDTIVLKRSQSWSTGSAVTHKTPDGGLEIVYQVYLGEELPASLAWYPPTPTPLPVRTQPASEAWESPHLRLVTRWNTEYEDVAFTTGGEVLLVGRPGFGLHRMTPGGEILGVIEPPDDGAKPADYFTQVGVGAKGRILVHSLRHFYVFDSNGVQLQEFKAAIAFDPSGAPQSQFFQGSSGVIAVGRSGQTYACMDGYVRLLDLSNPIKDPWGNWIPLEIAHWGRDELGGYVQDISGIPGKNVWALIQTTTSLHAFDASGPINHIELELPQETYVPKNYDQEYLPYRLAVTYTGDFIVVSDTAWLHYYAADGTWLWGEDIEPLGIWIKDISVSPEGYLAVLDIHHDELLILEIDQ